jgi:hypothetical protein
VQKYFLAQFESFAFLFGFSVQLSPVSTLLGGAWGSLNHIACHLFFLIFQTDWSFIVILVALVGVVVLVVHFIFGQVFAIKPPEFLVFEYFLFCQGFSYLN